MADWNMTLQQRLRWIEQCIDHGVSSFDHADIYGGYTVEALFGEALGAKPVLRGRMQLVTKCGIRLVSPERPDNALKAYDTTGAHVIASVEASLRALRTDHIDLLLIHRPDALMHPEMLAETFRQLRAAGKALHFGVSNHSPSQFALLHQRTPLVTNQIEFSTLQVGALSDGTLDQCLALGVRPMIWSPLAGGRLFNTADAQVDRVRTVLEELGQRHDASVCTMAYAWILRHPSRPVPITGSRRSEGLQEAIAALAIELSTQDWYRVLEASTGRPVA